MRNLMTFIILLFIGTTVFAQNQPADTLAPYQKNNKLPAFNLKQRDNSWYNVVNANDDKNVAIIVFNPDCHHCELEAEEISHNINKLADIHFLWVTTSSDVKEIEAFAQKYELNNHPNITFLLDPNYAVPIFYEVRTTPFIAIYNKQGILKKIFRNATTIAGILNAVK